MSPETKKIKVAHIITMLELGGAQQNTLYTVSHLDPLLFEPLLLAGTGGILDDEAKRMIPGIKLFFIRNLVRQVSPLRDISALVQIYLILKREKPDIVHTHSSKAGIIGRWAAHFAGIKIIIHTFHGFGFNDYQKKLTRTLFLTAEKWTATVSDVLVAVSRSNVNTAVKNKIGDEKKYVLVRSGIRLSDYRKTKLAEDEKNSVRNEIGIAGGEKTVTTIGPFKPQKNLADFVTAASIILKRVPGTKFLIVGDGEQRPLIENMISEAGIKQNVLLLNWRKDISRILSITDVFVLTSLWEGLPRAAVEAMCLAKPVVAYGVDGLVDIVQDGETGFLAEPKDINKLSERVITLLKDPVLSRKIGETARDSIDETFDIDYMVRQQGDLYIKQLLKYSLR
ncbi:MAG: glycosyltransferase family 4 protein [Elusimicrobiota bacterium]